MFAIFCSSPTDPSAGTKPFDGPNRYRIVDKRVRAATGRRQDDRVRPVHRQFRVLHRRVQRDQPVGGHAERAAVHVGYEELPVETRRERIPESGGKRA